MIAHSHLSFTVLAWKYRKVYNQLEIPAVKYVCSIADNVPRSDLRCQLVEETLCAGEVELLPQLSQGLELGRHDDTDCSCN